MKEKERKEINKRLTETFILFSVYLYILNPYQYQQKY